MKAPTHHFSRVPLERAVIAFFILAATSLLVVYGASPAIYAHSLALTSSPADRYPVPVTLFLVSILTVIALLILGVMRRWCWLMLVAFASSALHIPVTLLQMTGVLPTADPLWYGLFRMGVAVVELALAAWMIHCYRHAHGLRNELTILSESAPEAMVSMHSCASMRLSGQGRSRSAGVAGQWSRWW